MNGKEEHSKGDLRFCYLQVIEDNVQNNYANSANLYLFSIKFLFCFVEENKEKR